MKQILIIGFLILAVIISGCSVQQAQQQVVPAPTPTPAVTSPAVAPPAEQTAPSTPSEQNTSVPPNATSTSPQETQNVNNNIAISGFAFSPSTLTVPVGTSITWTNDDSVGHTVISDTGSEISSSSLAQGETYVHTFNTPGTYNYHCSIHPSMKGTIIVQ